MKPSLAIATVAIAAAGCSATTSGTRAAAPSSAPPVSAPAQPGFRPCDWVTKDEAAGILGGAVTARPSGDQAGSVDVACSYSRGPGENGLESTLRLPGGFPVDAASQFELTATKPNAASVNGIGLKAACVSEPTTTPPSTTLVVLLAGNRTYAITGWYALSCDTLKQVATAAIDRIGAFGAAPPAGAPSACAELGGTVTGDQTCHIRNATADYKIDISYPLDYPDQNGLKDVIARDRDRFLDWVAKAGPDGRGRPYEHIVTAKTYRSGTPTSGTQSLVLTISDDTGLAHQGHPNTSFTTLNYDLGKHAPITFDTLFKPGANPLEVLNPIVQREMGTPDGNFDARVYQNFALTNDAVIFFFGEDQVIPDNNGPHRVSIPRAELAPLLA